MFYGQCYNCGERWELGTAPSCTCPDEAEPYKFTDSSTEVLRLSKDGIWANPDIPADAAAKLVLAAMDLQIKALVDKAVEAEREQGQKWFDAVTAQHKQEILAEREVCAKIADTAEPYKSADLIRARGQA